MSLVTSTECNVTVRTVDHGRVYGATVISSPAKKYWQCRREIMFWKGNRPKQVRSNLSGGQKSKIRVTPALLYSILISIALLITTPLIAFSTSNSGASSSQIDLILPETDFVRRPEKVEPPSIESINAQVEHDSASLPSAKSLLTTPPPFQDSKVVRIADQLIKSPNTVVTGYFRVPSKYHPGKYDGWMTNMLSLQDAMVIFTQAEVVDQIKQMRRHALNRTVIVPLEIDQLPWGQLYTKEFWQDQLDRDPEKRIHRSYELFWIWLSKSWLTTQAIRMNFYDSDLFVWSDIGCFRDKRYNFQTLIQHREMVPPSEMIMMAHHKPNPPAEELFNDKYKHKDNFYHSGSQSAGFKDTWIKFHELFLDTIDRFLAKKMIIVEDQAVLQSTCLSHPEMCAYVPFNQVNDNHYFGLRYVLNNGGKIKLWRQQKATNPT